jgi:hypothetical protein
MEREITGRLKGLLHRRLGRQWPGDGGQSAMARARGDSGAGCARVRKGRGRGSITTLIGQGASAGRAKAINGQEVTGGLDCHQGRRL